MKKKAKLKGIKQDLSVIDDEKEKSELVTFDQDYRFIEQLPGLEANERNIAVMHNFIARAVTRWSLEESKLFIYALAHIGGHDEEGWVKLSKRELNQALDYKKRSSDWLRRVIKNVASNSWLHFDTKTGWDDGFVVNRTRSDRWNVYIRFEKEYLPLLEKLTSHFTTVYVESIARLNHKSSYSLYLYLKSWANHSGNISYRSLYRKDIHDVFNLDPDAYIKKEPNKNEKFNWYDFERFCLIPAVQDINNNEKGEIEILSIKKIKSHKKARYIDGYKFSFRLKTEPYRSLGKEETIAKTSKSVPYKKNYTLLMSDPLPSFEEVEQLLASSGINALEVFNRLVEQHRKRDIGDWRSYVEKIATNLKEEPKRKRSKHVSEELPDWYTYVPTKKATAELVLKTLLLSSQLPGAQSFTIEELQEKTKLPKKQIEFYIQNPDELEKVVASQSST